MKSKTTKVDYPESILVYFSEPVTHTPCHSLLKVKDKNWTPNSNKK